MLNHISIMGRLTKDVELRRTNTGTAVANFTLAVERDFSKDKETDFIECVAWGKTGEFAEKYFSKGKMAIVAGRLQIRKWEDKNGNKRSTSEVVAENIYFGESKTSIGDKYEAAMSHSALEPDYPAIYGDDEQLPF